MSNFEDDRDGFGLTLSGHNKLINLPDEVVAMFELEERADNLTYELELAEDKIKELAGLDINDSRILQQVIKAIGRRSNAKTGLEGIGKIRGMIDRWNSEQRQKAITATAEGKPYLPQPSSLVVQLAHEYREGSRKAYTEAQDMREIASDFEPRDDADENDA